MRSVGGGFFVDAVSVGSLFPSLSSLSTASVSRPFLEAVSAEVVPLNCERSWFEELVILNAGPLGSVSLVVEVDGSVARINVTDTEVISFVCNES